MLRQCLQLSSLSSLHEFTLSKALEKSICGDFNVVYDEIDFYHNAFDHCKPAQTYMEQDLFKALLSSGFSDVFRTLHPTSIKYTFWSYTKDHRANNEGYRSDYVLISSDEIHYCTMIDILSEYTSSNHAPMVVEVIV